MAMTAVIARIGEAGDKIAAARAEPLLEVRSVTLRFGGIVALDQVSFAVGEGLIAGLIGPNGAGKTSLFNCLSGLYRPQAGDILFEGRSLLAAPAHRMAAAGLGRTFQNLALFGSMTAIENVAVGTHARGRSGLLADALRLRSTLQEERRLATHAAEMLALVGLAEIAHRPVVSLPFGTRKRIELARALASEPRLLLLDEPAGGLNHEEVAALGALLHDIRDRLGITMLLVEHHMSFVMGLCDKVVALDFGRVIADGSPAEVQSDAAVARAYLGHGK
jgi:branched-chain amino acid transport system ATP-binding protein